MYKEGSVVVTKKKHVCQNDRWEVIRMGADVKLKCLKCGRVIMFPSYKLDKQIKKVEE